MSQDDFMDQMRTPNDHCTSACCARLDSRTVVDFKTVFRLIMTLPIMKRHCQSDILKDQVKSPYRGGAPHRNRGIGGLGFRGLGFRGGSQFAGAGLRREGGKPSLRRLIMPVTPLSFLLRLIRYGVIFEIVTACRFRHRVADDG